MEDDDSLNDIKIGHIEEYAEQNDAQVGQVAGRAEVEDEEMRDEPSEINMSDDKEI